jgi:hypothetical protein
MGSTESGLADRGLPWLAEATLCGALNSPAGLTFLSLRGAAPASFPDPFSTNPIRVQFHSFSARSTRLPPPLPTPAPAERVNSDQ